MTRTTNVGSDVQSTAQLQDGIEFIDKNVSKFRAVRSIPSVARKTCAVEGSTPVATASVPVAVVHAIHTTICR